MKVTRRIFLATTGMAPAVGPLVLGTADKAGIKAPVVGEGDHKYEATHDWGRKVTFISTTLFMPRVTAWIRSWCSMKKASS